MNKERRQGGIGNSDSMSEHIEGFFVRVRISNNWFKRDLINREIATAGL
jgi:hypothetical protein